ncbi:MAG: DmsC/YnfH family molybdoenzyme membrane anchor subunit [Tabrizicola sp.]|uniref:dimethyl sulfoxide reductase anchor subunit family protein n=1 Tax=Tabrizicola sp. TaxID=2005166 RepID=UPI002732610C|nr:DmsC/YnfH family molybdoenzyme membrane anchor subunit [Tabrizicola sp.]MDP3265170.1 DmsC/YnfH family molybdoenzyme membrane anchor subunit [Tabrizicola sp.]MDP3646938.1 DmsC/YnfH family molybdoenzyme membrane anchor subunit [Paracoccaceae bacterium]MDZ4069238.1 DmsC/YnfH family molybdoenzyme membrane anchor subunit [Tabrizicola sp.]
MHPAPSVIIFTVLSGLGFGFLAFVAAGALPVSGWPAVVVWGLGYGLAVGGLAASTFHLGNPQRALLAFSQWRTSWLSREAWTSVITLMLLAPMALSDWLGLGLPRAMGWVAAVMCVVSVIATSMIYAQIKAVPRWNHWVTPALFGAFSLTGGALLAGQVRIAAGLAVVLALVLVLAFRLGDRQFAARGATLGTATGLDRIGAPEVFELPHTGGNYLLREMIHVVGRKHARRLRQIAVIFAAVLPVMVLAVLPVHIGIVVAVALHLVGAFAARWLFFAEAEHVVGLYYGMR